MSKRRRSEHRRPAASRAAGSGERATSTRDGSSGDASATRATLLRRPWSRGLIFAVLSAVCVLVGVGYVYWAVLRDGATASGTLPSSVAVAPGGAKALAALAGGPHLVFRSTDFGDNFGKVALVPLNAPDGPRTMTALQCDRVHFAAGHGVCLITEPGLLTRYSGYTFGPDFQPRHKFPLGGTPSRARVSPDGRYAAITVFVTGHSYAAGNFSTQTTLIDTASGATLGNLEQFAISRDGKPFRAPDFNFWGVTFARDTNRFYATLASGGKTYLVEGDVAARRARVLHENVECPSLSPDNTRVAYKKRVSSGDSSRWQFNVLDLSTLKETPLSAETRGVDDQVEWLDDSHIAYAVQDDSPADTVVADVWALRADGSGTPRLLMHQAYSPAVVRP